MELEKSGQDSRDFTIDFVRGICLPLMMVDQLRNHWLSLFTYRPLGFFCAAAVFVFLSGFSVGKFFSGYTADRDLFLVYRKVWQRALRIYGLHLGVTAMIVALAVNAPFGREIEVAVAQPWRVLLDSVLLHSSAPMLEFLPMYVFFLLLSPWLLRRFQAGQVNGIFGISFLIWAGAQAGYSLPMPPFTRVLDGAAWQLLFVSALYLGFRRARQPLERPQGTKGLNLGLFGFMLAMAMLRHAEVFGLGALAEAVPAWWIERSTLGPLVLLNLYLWVAFLWLVPEPLVRMARQGRVFVAMGQYAFPLVTWQILLFYVFMSWFPHLSGFSILGQALVVCFAVLCLVLPVSLFLTSNRSIRQLFSSRQA